MNDNSFNIVQDPQHSINTLILIFTSFPFVFDRRQTAEEREQERQAATKYFLSMQLGSLGPPPPHMDPNNLVNRPHLSPEPTPLPPSSLTQQPCNSPPLTGRNNFSSSSPPVSPTHGNMTSHSFQPSPISPSETLLPGNKNIEGSVASTDPENKSSINALECLRPWTSPHSPHFAALSSARATANAIGSSMDITTDASIKNII